MTDSELHLRHELTPDDVEAIHVLVASSGVFSAEEIDVAVELAEDKLSHRDASTYRFVFAEIGGQPVGYTCFGRIPLTAERYDLYWIVVDGNAQQKGIASRVLKETEAAIAEAGGKALYAETSSRVVYAPAHAFYRSAGFKELARIRDFYADGDDKLMFGKALK